MSLVEQRRAAAGAESAAGLTRFKRLSIGWPWIRDHGVVFTNPAEEPLRLVPRLIRLLGSRA